MANNQIAVSPVSKLKGIISTDSVKAQFHNALKENTGLFIASLIDVYASDKTLQKCDPTSVVMEALKAATLKLPINKNLGFAYIVPFKGKATMQIGYKGYLQLAIRTGQYRRINADVVYEGELLKADKLSGDIDLSGEATSSKIVGYFAHLETLNGFVKTIFWTTEKVTEHAKKYSQSFGSSYSPWKKQFDQMAIKTVLRNLLSKYGIMSVDMVSALQAVDDIDVAISHEQTDAIVDQKANTKMVDFQEEKAPETTIDESTGQRGEDGFAEDFASMVEKEGAQ